MELHKLVEQLPEPALGEVDGGGNTDLATGLAKFGCRADAR